MLIESNNFIFRANDDVPELADALGYFIVKPTNAPVETVGTSSSAKTTTSTFEWNGTGNGIKQQCSYAGEYDGANCRICNGGDSNGDGVADTNLSWYPTTCSTTAPENFSNSSAQTSSGQGNESSGSGQQILWCDFYKNIKAGDITTRDGKQFLCNADQNGTMTWVEVNAAETQTNNSSPSSTGSGSSQNNGSPDPDCMGIDAMFIYKCVTSSDGKGGTSKTNTERAPEVRTAPVQDNQPSVNQGAQTAPVVNFNPQPQSDGGADIAGLITGAGILIGGLAIGNMFVRFLMRKRE